MHPLGQWCKYMACRADSVHGALWSCLWVLNWPHLLEATCRTGLVHKLDLAPEASTGYTLYETSASDQLCVPCLGLVWTEPRCSQHIGPLWWSATWSIHPSLALCAVDSALESFSLAHTMCQPHSRVQSACGTRDTGHVLRWMPYQISPVCQHQHKEKEPGALSILVPKVD